MSHLPLGPILDRIPFEGFCRYKNSLRTIQLNLSPHRPGLTEVTVGDIKLGKKLGDGASGEVFEGTLSGREVAVKFFRSDVSPDGRCD
jgi:hypothetical protein